MLCGERRVVKNLPPCVPGVGLAAGHHAFRSPTPCDVFRRTFTEIKELLRLKKLHLAQLAGEQGTAQPFQPESLLPDKHTLPVPGSREGSQEDIASEVMGAVQRPRVTGRYVVDLETISGPLVQEGTVLGAGCLGCGYCLELLEAGANRLAKLAGAQKPESWDGYYFEAQRCPICDRDYREVALKRISDLNP